MMFQQFVAARDSGGFEERIRPYVSQVLMVIFLNLRLQFLCIGFMC